MKIPGMEGSREEAKRNYKRYIEQYCIASLGRPLEKLSVSCPVSDAIQCVVTHGSGAEHPSSAALSQTPTREQVEIYTYTSSIKYIRIHQ